MEKKTQRFQSLPTIHITKTSHTFSPASLNSLKDTCILYVASVPHAAAVVDYRANVRVKRVTMKIGE